MPKLISILDAAKRLGVAIRTLQKNCARGKVSGAIKRAGTWMIPASFDPRLCEVKGPEKRAGKDTLLDIPADKRDEAIRRLGLIGEADAFIGAAVREGLNRCDSLERFALGKQINPRTLRRWMDAWRAEGLLGLVDKRGGQQESESIHPAAWDFFKRLWLDPRRPSVVSCLGMVRQHSKENNLDWQIPAERTMYDLIDRRIPEPTQILYREGQEAYAAKCEPYILNDPDSIEPGAIWVGDHHCFNVWVRHRGEWIRPWVTAWEDMRSRAIVGYHLSDSPNQTTILQAMKAACEKHGPPDSVKIDNGKDYDSELWTGTTKARRKALGKGYLDENTVRGLYGMLGVTVSFAIPYHPKSKAIERWFATLDSQFCKTVRTYCGKDTDSRPEGLNEYLKTQAAIDEAYTLESFTATVGRYIEAYNNTAHTGRGMDGRSPNEVLATRTRRKVLLDGVLDLLCQVWSGDLVVGKNGVKFNGHWFGQCDTQLLAIQGRKVRVSYNPADLSRVNVYDAESHQFITIAEQAAFVRYGVTVGESESREAHRKIARAKKIHREYGKTMQDRFIDATHLAIRAAQDNARPEPAAAPKPRILKPVGTVLDGQVKARDEAIKQKTARAAGSELDIDFDLMKPQQRELPEFDIDFDAMYEKNHPGESDNPLGLDWRKLKKPRIGGANMDHVLELHGDHSKQKTKKQQAS